MGFVNNYRRIEGEKVMPSIEPAPDSWFESLTPRGRPPIQRDDGPVAARVPIAHELVDQIAIDLGMRPRAFISELSDVGLSVGNQMVIIPEEHILGMYGSYGEGRAFKFDEYEANRDAAPSSGSAGANAMAAAQRMIRPPDPAGETEITVEST